MTQPWSDPSRSPVDRVEALLDAMSVREQVAQLASTWQRGDQADDDQGDDDRDDDRTPDGDVAPMVEAMRSDHTWEEIRRHGLGHLTRVFGTRPISPTDGMARLAGLQHDLQAHSRLGVPAIAHEECLTGFTTHGATVHPTPLALAATFDPALVRRLAATIGRDLRAVGVHQALAPVLDVVRDPRWGRTEESFGEDPHLVGTMAAAYVGGLESTGLVATLKHFAGYAASRAARNHAPVSIGPREFADVVLVPFEMALRLGGARSVMNSYADVDGVPPAADAALLTTLLRDEWGFDGTVVSDYGSIGFLASVHRVAASIGDAAAMALTAGIDVELPEAQGYGDDLAARVEAGEVDPALVDRAVRRVLHQKLELGLLDADWSPPAPEAVDLDSPANQELARTAAARSLVLLANDGTLPLGRTPDADRIAVVGPGSDDPNVFLGCYSYPNHVLPLHPGVGLGIDVPTLVAALEARWPDTTIDHAPGTGILDGDDGMLAAAVTTAAGADLAVVVLADLPGMFGRGTSGEGNDATDLWLPGRQQELAEAVLDTGTPTVLVVVSGRPYALGGLADRAAAVVQAFLPGQAAGSAIADLLAGAVEPQGRLPIQVPTHGGGMPAGYLHPVLGEPGLGISKADTVVAFPFGHGLSWTRFDLTDLTVSTDEAYAHEPYAHEPSTQKPSADETPTHETPTHEPSTDGTPTDKVSTDAVSTDATLVVACRVTNVGDRHGTEVVQLYLDDPVAEVVRPVRQLLGFARVELAPGESAVVAFEVHTDRLAYTGLAGNRIVDAGTTTFLVGRSSGDLPLRADVTLAGPTRTVGHDRVLTTPATVT